MTKVHRNDLRSIGLCCFERYGIFATATELEGGRKETVVGRRSGRPRSGNGAKCHRIKKKE